MSLWDAMVWAAKALYMGVMINVVAMGLAGTVIIGLAILVLPFAALWGYCSDQSWYRARRQRIEQVGGAIGGILALTLALLSIFAGCGP